MEPKPGIKSSELWLNLISAILGVLMVYGLLDQQQVNAWLVVAGAAVPAVIAIVYTWSRTRVKEAAAKNGRG